MALEMKERCERCGATLSPERDAFVLYRATRERRNTAIARLTVARKIGKRAYHALRELELTAA